ncbi:unnamed protein product [Owenia fusiformis]|uniref:Uncharacterized protein n=1 Tax=Owenia fusiformis TaxID=6347 RepID=A0A8J1YBL8_OWEFU|nr:unnamed protein product [Owenia fusiformis]
MASQRSLYRVATSICHSYGEYQPISAHTARLRGVQSRVQFIQGDSIYLCSHIQINVVVQYVSYVQASACKLWKFHILKMLHPLHLLHETNPIQSILTIQSIP